MVERMDLTPAVSPGSEQKSSPQPRFRGRALAFEQGQSFPKTVSQDEQDLNFDVLATLGSSSGSEQGGRPKSPASPSFGLESGSTSPVLAPPKSRSPASGGQKSPPRAVPPLPVAEGAVAQGADSPLPSTSPPSQMQWGAQRTIVMTQRVDELRKHVDELLLFCTNLQKGHQLLVGEFVRMRNSLLQMDTQAASQKHTLEDLGRLHEEQQSLTTLLQQAVHKTQAQLEASDKRGAALKNSLATVQHRTDTLQGNYAALTDHLVKSMEDQFEMLGPLPADHVRIDTLNGPLPLHKKTQLQLRPYVAFSQSDHGAPGGPSRIHVNVTKELLANLAAWANGLYVGEEVLGHGALWSLYCYGRSQGFSKLQEDFGKELHSAGLDASTRVLNAHAKERRHHAMPYVSKMVDAIAQVIRSSSAAQDANKITVRIPLGLAAEPGFKNQPLYADTDTMPEWRADVARAFLAATEYCKKYHVACGENPQLSVHDASRALTLLIECRLPY
jgi:hypothetical protein